MAAEGGDPDEKIVGAQRRDGAVCQPEDIRRAELIEDDGLDVVRGGSFSSASRRRSMTPSSIVRQIDALEHGLGVTLFHALDTRAGTDRCRAAPVRARAATARRPCRYPGRNCGVRRQRDGGAADRVLPDFREALRSAGAERAIGRVSQAPGRDRLDRAPRRSGARSPRRGDPHWRSGRQQPGRHEDRSTIPPARCESDLSPSCRPDHHHRRASNIAAHRQAARRRHPRME